MLLREGSRRKMSQGTGKSSGGLEEGSRRDLSRDLWACGPQGVRTKAWMTWSCQVAWVPELAEVFPGNHYPSSSQQPFTLKSPRSASLFERFPGGLPAVGRDLLEIST